MSVYNDVISNTVTDVFSKGFASIYENDTLSKCLSILKMENLHILAVFDSNDNYKGVITTQWIIRSRLDPSTTKVKALMRYAPKVLLVEALSKVARLMIESNISQLPVYSGKKLLGFIADHDVIHGAVMERWGNAKITKIMTENLFIVDEYDSIGHVFNLFREQDISHAPVVSNGKLVGLITIYDIIDNVILPKQRQTRGELVGEKRGRLDAHIKDLMSKPVITVLPTNKLSYAAEKMRELDISSLVVISNGKLLGIVAIKDFLEAIAQKESVSRKVTIYFSIRDVRINDFERSTIVEVWESLVQRYKEMLESSTLFVYMKTHGKKYKEKQLIHCRLQLRTNKKSFFSNSEEWNVVNVFRKALNKLDKQILKSKELEYNAKIN